MFVSSEVVPLTRSRASVKIVDLYSSKKTVNSLSDNNSIYFYQVRRHHPSCGTAHVAAPAPIASIAHSALSTSTSTAHINDLSQNQNQSHSQSKDRSTSDSEQRTPSHATHSNVEVEVNGDGDGEHAVAERERESLSRLHLTAAVVTQQPGLDRNSSDENIEEKLPESRVEVDVEPTVR